MKVRTPGLDNTRPFHALTAVCILPKNVIPTKRTKAIVARLSNGKKIKFDVCIHNGESLSELGQSMKRDISGCVKVAKTIFSSR